MAYNFRNQIEVIEKQIPLVYNRIYTPVAEVKLEVFVTPEPVSFEERKSGKRKVVKRNDYWAEAWECGWFHITGRIPESAKGKKVVLYLDFHGEICIFDSKGNPVQALTSGSCLDVSRDYGCFGIRKREFLLNECAEGGENIDLWADASCNYIIGVGEHNRPELGKIEFADISICRDNVKSLFYDMLVLYYLMNEQAKDSARYHCLRQSLFEASCMLYDYGDDEIERSAIILKAELDKRCGDEDLRLTAIGHSHIDLAWLWPIRETKRKGVRTFANALRNMDKYPDFVFGASQPQLYEWVKEEQPALYEKIKERVKENRWEIQGAMWVEPDANITGGEAFVRQLLYGKKYFRKDFGKNMKILWLPDVFGYSAALPQILKKSGVPYFMTTKLGWGNRHNKPPHHTFRWKGIDGSEILAHMPPEGDYNSFALPGSIKKIERTFADKGICDEALMPYGIGDGGGGPGELMLEALKREKCLLGLIPVQQGFAIDFFDRIAKNQEKYQVFDGELYFEMHQGTYTTQSRSKWYNRKMEKLLREAEFAAIVTKSQYPQQRLEKIWKEILLYQFHDILPGSSIKRVYDESLARYDVLYDETKKLTESLYGKGEYAINSLSWDRCGWEKLLGKWYKLNVPALGSTKLENGIDSNEITIPNRNVLENDRIKVAFNHDGSIFSIYDKKNNRETLKSASNRFAVYVDHGDAWDFSEGYRSTIPKFFELVETEMFTDGPIQGIKQKYVFKNSRLWQTIIIKEESPIVEFDTRVDWREKERMLRTAFDTSIVTSEVSCDIQYGTVKRATHSNTSWDMAKFEICVHKYADLSDANYGIALMNDCKYGYYAKYGVLDLNLLRSPSYPDETADIAEHKFRYAFYPHNGSLENSDVIRKSYEFNQPLWVGERISQLFSINNSDVIVESIKKAEEGDSIIIRMYESKGAETKAALRFNIPVKSAYMVDLMEENEKPIDLEEILFHVFEIVTVKIEIEKQ